MDLPEWPRGALTGRLDGLTRRIRGRFGASNQTQGQKSAGGRGNIPTRRERTTNRLRDRRNQRGIVRAHQVKRQTVRVVRIATGFVLLAAGVAMLALPGPGWLTIAAGLALLAGEFEWARNLLNRLKATAGRIGDAMRKG